MTARRRVPVALLLALTAAAALASRRWPLPGVLAEHTGDALYTTAAFWTLALLRPAAGRAPLAAAALLLSALVECSQLWQNEWLDAARATAVGRLLLGQGFQWADLLAYALGAAAAALLDAGLRRRDGATAAPPAHGWNASPDTGRGPRRSSR
ncbi:MAG: DUF2809 domain-containing protein [Planctomycetota bacterium]